MRSPLRAKAAPQAQVSQVVSMPAPIGGWNAKNSKAAMPVTDAIKLLNWFPTTVDCELRGGHTAHGTVTGVVETLAVYNEMDGTNSMFAISDTDLYDVTSSGAGTAKSLTITDGKWQYVNFGDGTNSWLILVNGVDAPYFFDGTTWTLITGVSSPAITNVTPADLIHVCVHQKRLYFIEKDTLSFWYNVTAGAAGGALTEFDLSSYASDGGYLMWAQSWSIDAGDGPDDAIVFMTSEGQAIVYRGNDPATAADWVLMGVYTLGKPLGRRSFLKYGGDLLAITQNGIWPLSKALQSSTIDESVALTDKIENAFNAAARNYGSSFGWDGTLLPLRSAILFNIPVSVGGIHKQYVMNTITGAWCEFDSWDGECFVEFDGDLYFGASGVVRKAWTGTVDISTNITAIGKTAFNYFGQTSQQKRITFFRPLVRSNGTIVFKTGIDVDFSDNNITGTTSFSPPSGSVWDTAKWDEGTWQGGLDVIRQWTSPTSNIGYAISGGLEVAVQGLEVHWDACDYVFEPGGVL